MSCRRRFRATPLGLAVLALVGCVDDPSALDDDPIPISRAEAELLGLGVLRDALEARLVAGADDALEAGAQATGGAAMDTVLVSAAFDTTVSCAMAGSIYLALALSGEVDDVNGGGLLDLSAVQVHRDCREQEGGEVFSLRGSPSIRPSLLT